MADARECCTAVRFHGCSAGDRLVGIRVRRACHRGRVQLKACACAAARGSDSRGAHVSGDGCAAGCAVQEGGRAGSG